MTTAEAQGLSDGSTIPAFNINSSSLSAASCRMKDMMVSSKYSSKPFLFGADGKIPNFNSCKAEGMLDRFEEEKRKAKEKYEREILTHGILQLQESLENIRENLLNRIDGSNDMTRKVLEERMDIFSKTIDGYLNKVREGITCQFETLQSQTQIGMDDREGKISMAAKDLGSNMLNLKQSLEQLKAEQSKEQGMLGEILSQLGTLIAFQNPIAGPSSARMIDSEVQTSPGLLERFCVMSAKKHYQSIMLCNRPVIYSRKAAEQNLCPLKTSKTQIRNAHILPAQIQQQLKQTEVTEEFSPGPSQRLWCTQLVATRPSSPLVDATSNASIEENGREYVDRLFVHMEPEKPLYVRENRLGTYTETLSPPKVLRRCQNTPNFRGKKRPLVLPQRQAVRKKGTVKISKDSQEEDIQSEQKDRVPLSSLCEHWKMNSKSVEDDHLRSQQQASVAPVSRCVAEEPLNPFSMWSQDTNSSQMVVEYKTSEWEEVVPKPKGNVIEEGGLWQLFDFNNDSE
ncbi:interactor of HORMAD1 protein 1 [Xyrauchen texanus]|uniref:interactor of HORMAD1 protein 1 n=1 Tax=Xyrauchen texanus TaxID=154827 RepID=UPI002241C7A9|nr:interactor of HORMAD1 protein 1 [Xyrauchen texanus]